MLSTFQFKLSYQKTFQQISFSGYFLPFFTAYLLGRYLMNQTLFSAKILPLVKIFLKLLTCTPYFASLFLLIVEAFIIRIQISRSVNFFFNLQKRGCQNPFLAAYQVRGEFQNKYFRMWQFDYNPDLDATKPPFSSATYWAVFFISGVWNVPVSENSLLRPLMNFLWILKNEDVF